MRHPHGGWFAQAEAGAPRQAAGASRKDRRRGRRFHLRRAAAGTGALALALAACAPPARQGGFHSPNPASQMYAIEDAARQGDPAAIASLVEALDSDDPAVRLMAIESLRRITGEDLGYRHFDPPEVREEAVARWVDLARREGWAPSAAPAASAALESSL